MADKGDAVATREAPTPSTGTAVVTSDKVETVSYTHLTLPTKRIV